MIGDIQIREISRQDINFTSPETRVIAFRVRDGKFQGMGWSVLFNMTM